MDILDLTHDIGVPVAAAISGDAAGSNLAYGFAAKMIPSEAAVSATLEMLQGELSLDLARQREELVGQPEGSAGRFLVWSRTACLARLPHLRPHAAAIVRAPVPPETDPTELVERVTGAAVLFVDLDRPTDPLSVVRAIVPGLRHWKPRFAPGRLFDVPAKLGWAHQPIDETCIGPDVILI